MMFLPRFVTASSNAVHARTATWLTQVQENASFVLQLLVRTVHFVLVDAELRPLFATTQSLFAKRRQQRPQDDLPPPLLPPLPPSRPWAGSGRRRRRAPAVIRPRPPPPPAHYHSTRVMRRSPPLPYCRQLPRSRRAFLVLGRGAANGSGIISRPYTPPGDGHTFTTGKGAVPENDGVSSHAFATSPSRAVAVF